MTLVIADTGPVRYLLVLGSIDILRQLYGGVVIPKSVVAELTHPNAPCAVRDWSSALPDWVTVKAAENIELEGVLDLGEAEAIALAQELRSELILIDEREARKEASNRGLRVTGTVGVLEQAADRGLVDLAQSLRKLIETNFRIDPAFIRDALARDAARQVRQREIGR